MPPRAASCAKIEIVVAPRIHIRRTMHVNIGGAVEKIKELYD